MVIDTTSLFL